LIYEYGPKWNVKIIIMSSYQPAKDDAVRFVAGDGAAPPESIDGPRQFNRILTSLETGGNSDKQAALRQLGADFVPGHFDLEKVNRNLREAWLKR
jgi:hypothetical protein